MPRAKTPANPPATEQSPAPRPAEEFDESTPPPRQRPKGYPAPAYVRLPPGEEAAAHFAAWDREGRVPAGSILLRFLGNEGNAARSGYCDLRGRAVMPETLEPLEVVSVVVQTLKTGTSTFAVFAG